MKVILYTSTESENLRISSIISQKDDGVENEVFNIYPEVKYQTFEGFGGAITDSAGYVFSKLSEEQQNEILDTYFSPENMGYNQVRIHMDSCDFSTHMYEADPNED